MTKTVCDICGKEMATTIFTDAIGNLNCCVSSFGRKWDICNDCRADFNRWMDIRKSGSTTKEQTGYWMIGPYGFKCSKCLIVHKHNSIYCPSCGTRMVESPESEE